MAKLRPSGGYRTLRGFRAATVIYDATYWFCEKFLEPRSRMADQMVQAARSGRQNIAEGSRASATSSQTELRLMNVARSSLEELLLDFEDYLRHRHLAQWLADSAEALAVRDVSRRIAGDDTEPTPAEDYGRYTQWLNHEDPAIRANALICLIHQANYLLDQQIAALEAQFVEEGGYSEQLATARLQHRRSNAEAIQPKDSTNSAPIPCCPLCGKLTVLRTAQKGKNPGKQFWGCTGYPDCRGIVEV
jgi:restriction system protein